MIINDHDGSCCQNFKEWSNVKLITWYSSYPTREFWYGCCNYFYSLNYISIYIQLPKQKYLNNLLPIFYTYIIYSNNYFDKWDY